MKLLKLIGIFTVFFISCFTAQAQQTPTYEKEIKAVQRGIDQAIDARLAVANYFAKNNIFPRTNRQAGLAYPQYFKSDAVKSVTIGAGGIIVIIYHSKKLPAINGYNIILQSQLPRKRTGKAPLAWDCRLGTMPKKFRPAQCQ